MVWRVSFRRYVRALSELSLVTYMTQMFSRLQAMAYFFEAAMPFIYHYIKALSYNTSTFE